MMLGPRLSEVGLPLRGCPSRSGRHLWVVGRDGMARCARCAALAALRPRDPIEAEERCDRS